MYMKTIITIISFVLLLFLTSCEKEVFTDPNGETKSLIGKLYIESKPKGFKIYFEGKYTGFNTPDSIRWLAAGEYKIKLRKELFSDTTFTIKIEDGNQKSIFVDYFLSPGQFGNVICVSTPPGADIFLNDSLTTQKTPYTFTHLFPGYYEVKYSLPEHRTDSLTVAVSSKQIQTANKTLIDTSVWVGYMSHNSRIQSNMITSIAYDKNNVKWIGTFDKGLISYDGKNWITYKYGNSPMPANYVTCALVDHNNTKWIGTTNGLVSLLNDTWMDYTSNLPSKYVTSIIEDKNNNIWIGTGSGLVKFDGANWKIFNKSNSGIADNFVVSMAVDKDNRIWVGGSNAGISVYDGRNWIFYNNSNMSLPKSVGMKIKSIFIDDANDVWVSNVIVTPKEEFGDVTFFDGNNWSLKTLNGFENIVTNIFCGKEDFFFIGTRNGLIQIKNSEIYKVYRSVSAQGLTSSKIESLTIDVKGDLWIATFGGGLNKLKHGNF